MEEVLEEFCCQWNTMGQVCFKVTDQINTNRAGVIRPRVCLRMYHMAVTIQIKTRVGTIHRIRMSLLDGEIIQNQTKDRETCNMSKGTCHIIKGTCRMGKQTCHHAEHGIKIWDIIRIIQTTLSENEKKI